MSKNIKNNNVESFPSVGINWDNPTYVKPSINPYK